MQHNQIATDIAFTAAELERIAEHFAGSNDELGASIAAKARELNQ
jgi:hypothetical protein